MPANKKTVSPQVALRGTRPPFRHTLDDEWIQRRRGQAEWILKNERWLGATKAQAKGLSDYFVNGDLDAWIRKVDKKGDPILFHEAVFYSPARSIDEFEYVFHTYWHWVLTRQGATGPWAPEECKSQLHATCLSFADWDAQFFDPDVALELFKWVFGNSFDPGRRFPMPLGPDHWQPVLAVDLNDLFIRLARGLKAHLFNCAGKYAEPQELRPETYRKYPALVDYLLSLFPHIDLAWYSKQLLEAEAKLAGGCEIGRHQAAFRSFVACLEGINVYAEGYDGAELEHKDPVLEAWFKQRLTEIKLPPQHAEFVDFVRKHKEAVLTAEA